MIVRRMLMVGLLVALLLALIGCAWLGPSINIILPDPVPDGIVGASYQVMAEVMHGRSPYRWKISENFSGVLPPGLSLDEFTGLISGRPTAAGTFPFTLQVTDTNADVDIEPATIRVADALVITTTGLANGTEGQAYNQTVTTTGGWAPLSFNLQSGSLPPGLALDSSTGVVSGTPTGGAAFNKAFEVRVQDSLNPPQTVLQNYAVLILKVTTASLPNGTENQPYAPVSLAVEGQVDPVTWSVTLGALPPGMTLSPAGVLSGTPTVAGVSNFTVSATDSDSPPRTDTQDLTLTIGSVNPMLTITTVALPDGVMSMAYSQTLNATGGATPYTWSVSNGALPGGLLLDAGTGEIFGSPTVAGTFNFTAQVDDASVPALSDQQALSLIILPSVPALDITTTALPDGVVGMFYSQTLQATGGTTPYQWSLAAGAPPNGLILDSTGVISGTPTVAGTFNFTAQVDDAGMPAQSDQQALAIRINLAAPQPQVEQLVSVRGDGTLSGNGESFEAASSADGRYVAFVSQASNLVANDNNNAHDIFVRDTVAGSTVRVSVASDGTEGDGNSENPSISADGRFVAFDSQAQNLVPLDINQFLTDVFVHDRDVDGNGTFDEPNTPGMTDKVKTVLLSVNTLLGTQGNSDSLAPSISADGRFVAFASFANDLITKDTNLSVDVFVHDRDVDKNGIFDEPNTPGLEDKVKTAIVSALSDGTEANNASSGIPAISADGRYVAFASRASNLVANDNNSAIDIFVRDTLTGSMARLSVNSAGMETGVLMNSFSPSISADGRFVAFATRASNLVPGDTNGVVDAFVRDRDVDGNGTFDEPNTPGMEDKVKTVRVSVNSNGVEGDGQTLRLSISADGRFVAFESESANLDLALADTNGNSDVFVHDRDANGNGVFDEPGNITTVRVSVSSAGMQGIDFLTFGSQNPSISADGRFVAFESAADNLVLNDSNGLIDVLWARTGRP